MSNAVKPVEIFFAYAHKDKALRDQLAEHLIPLKQRGSITMWYDHDISPGAEWQQAIDEHLNKAHLILLLISPAFMSSGYCYSQEMRQAVERHDSGKARIIPILLRPVDWQEAPFGKLQALPRSIQPITRTRNRDLAFFEVAQAIQKTVEELFTQFASNLQEAEKKKETLYSESEFFPTLSPTTLPETKQRVGSGKTSEPQEGEEKAPLEGKKIALIVGVNNTQRSSLLPDLKYAEDDAHEIASTLRTSACNFVCLQTALTGEKAETQTVRRALLKLAQQRTTQDFLLFYFLGHALPVRTIEGDADIYLVTSDFNETEVVEDSTAYLSLRWLREKLYRPDTVANVLIILDCCYTEKMIPEKSDLSNIDISQLVKECIGYPSVMEQDGCWRFVLTASTYTAPAQERRITSLLLAILQGRVQKVLDERGNVNVHTLYAYLQDELSLAQLPNLPDDFPQSWIIATYHEKSRSYLQQLQQANTITDPEYFKSLAALHMPFHIQWFDRIRDTTASVLDLNQEKISKFFTLSLVQIQDDFSSGASDIDQLEQLGLLQGLYPTYGALLCFGINPTRWVAGAFTRCTLWRTNDRHNGWLEAQDYQRDLLTQFASSRDFIRRHLRLTRVIGRDERVEELEIPLVALEEALANALIHREYANKSSPVYVDIFYDRIEICSPGAPPEPMTMELLGEEHKSHPRHPQIARIFYLYGHVEKVGSGIQRIQNYLQKIQLRAATFELGRDQTFKVTFYRPQQSSGEFVSQLVSKQEHTVDVGYSSADAPLSNKTAENIDVCVICALPEEADEFMRALTLRYGVVFEKSFSKRSKRESRYAVVHNNSGEQLTLLVSWSPIDEAVETSLHLKSMLEECRPRFVAMTGICAGDRRKVKLGDIIVADRTFTYDNGKFVRDENRQVYLHDTDTRHADPTVLQFVRMFDTWKPSVRDLARPRSRRQQREWLLCQLLEGTTPRVDDIPLELLNKNAPVWRKIVHELQEKPHCYLTKDRMLRDKAMIEELFYSEEIFPFQDPEQPECYIAPMASGSAIRGDDPFNTIRIPVRGTVGVDMEGATFYRTMADFPGIRSLLVKGVADYADREKDDEYHIYAAEVSALYVFSFIKEYVTFDLMPRRGYVRKSK